MAKKQASDPYSAAFQGAGVLGDLISAWAQPDPPEELPGNLVVSNPMQWNLYKMLKDAYTSGSGDYGLGSNIKAGMSNLQQMMADRGISPESGVYNSALSNMIAQATEADAASRRDYGLNLLRTPVQTAVISGENLLPRYGDSGNSATPQPVNNQGHGNTQNYATDWENFD